jgi:hypothetical protein
MLTREIHIGLVALSPDLRLNSHISTFALLNFCILVCFEGYFQLAFFLYTGDDYLFFMQCIYDLFMFNRAQADYS